MYYLQNKETSLTVSSECFYNTITAFACKAKSFAIACVVVVFLLLVGVSVMHWQKFFINFLSFAAQKACVTRIRLFSLDTLANVFVSVLFSVKFYVYDQNMPCALEINSNSGFKWENVESSLQKLKPSYLHYHNAYDHQLIMRGSHT